MRRVRLPPFPSLVGFGRLERGLTVDDLSDPDVLPFRFAAPGVSSCFGRKQPWRSALAEYCLDLRRGAAPMWRLGIGIAFESCDVACRFGQYDRGLRDVDRCRKNRVRQSGSLRLSPVSAITSRSQSEQCDVTAGVL